MTARAGGIALLALLVVLAPLVARPAPPEKPADAIRVALFNVSLARGAEGKLITELRSGAGGQIDAIAEIVQRVEPDILILLELDWDPAGEALALFEAELARGRGGAEGVVFADRYAAPVNAGTPSGIDLNGDGVDYGPEDAYGWGVFPGQFGIALLSRYPIDAGSARSFRLIRWAETPFAELRPRSPNGAAFHSEQAWAALRLSSKTHLDAPVRLPDGRALHLLVSHPTPPVFDGPEDANGARNAAEILFWLDYIAGADWIRDDQGRFGGLERGASFIVAGDLNADPVDGDGRRAAIRALLGDPRLQDAAPRAAGGAAAAAAQAGANAEHDGDPAEDTADWRDDAGEGPGNLRVDYLLPSADLLVLDAGVFWPAPGDPLFPLVGEGYPVVSSDHRLVWIDIAPR